LISPGSGGLNIAGSGISVTIHGLVLNGSASSANGVAVTGSGITLHIAKTQIYGYPGNGINAAPSGGSTVTTTVIVTDSRISDCYGAYRAASTPMRPAAL
jgi:hypothetical protein